MESSSEENGTDDSGGDDDSDAEEREPDGKTTSALFMSNDAEDGVLVPESQASKMDVAGDTFFPCICLCDAMSDHELLNHRLSFNL